MGVTNRTSPTDSLLSDGMRAEVAYLLSRGKSWEEAATVFGWDAAKLRSTAWRDPHFETDLARARLDEEREIEAAVLTRLHEFTESADPEQAAWAVNLLTKHITARRRDETRLAVEQFRARRMIAHAEAEKAKTVEEPGVVVYLSAGDRRVTDTPLQLIRDKDAQVNGKPVFWAVPLADATKARCDPRTPEPPKPRVAPEG
jgi:hypothetical protein